MASYNPPIEDLPIFDSSLFHTANTETANITGNFLNYPVAQGAEILKDTEVNGILTVDGEVTFAQDLHFSKPSGAEITGLEDIYSTGGHFTSILTDELGATGNITCKTLIYQELDPAVGGSQTLAQTLTFGNTANNQAITNLGGLTMTGNINVGNYDIDSVANLNFFNGDGIGQNSLNTIKFVNVANVPFYLQNGDIQGINNQTFKMKDDTNDYVIVQNQGVSQIKLNSQKLIRGVSSTNQSNSSYGYIMDTLVKPPLYKQIFSSVNHTTTLNLDINPSYIFGVNIYPTSADQVFNVGINYAEILFSYFQINFTSPTTFPLNNNCTIFLSNSPTPVADPTKGNAITFTLPVGQTDYTFTSSVPIILYYQNGDLGTYFTDLYFNITIANSASYTVSLQNCNFAITAYVAGKNTEPLFFNA